MTTSNYNPGFKFSDVDYAEQICTQCALEMRWGLCETDYMTHAVDAVISAGTHGSGRESS